MQVCASQGLVVCKNTYLCFYSRSPKSNAHLSGVESFHIGELTSVFHKSLDNLQVDASSCISGSPLRSRDSRSNVFGGHSSSMNPADELLMDSIM